MIGGSRTDTVARYVAALAALAAGIIHLRVTPAHFDEAFIFGAFMLTVGVVQLAVAAWLLVRPSPVLLRTVIAGTGSIFVVFAVAYTVGLPVGPRPGERESLGTLVVLSKVAEFVLLLASVYLVAPAVRRQHTSRAFSRHR